MTVRSISALFLVLLVLLSQAAGCAPAMRQTVLEENATVAPTLRPRQPATATVNTRSLRVRDKPFVEAAVIWGVNAGETYPVIGRSSDGMWLQLDLPKAPEKQGWVAADLVTVQGSIADAVIVEVPTPRPTLRPRPPVSPLATPGATAVLTATAVVALPTATPRPVPAVTPAPGYALVVTDGTRLRVRAAPTADAEIVGYVYPGETYRVVESSADGQWIRIAGAEWTPTENPSGGWVAAPFLVVRPAGQ